MKTRVSFNLQQTQETALFSVASRPTLTACQAARRKYGQS